MSEPSDFKYSDKDYKILPSRDPQPPKLEPTTEELIKIVRESNWSVWPHNQVLELASRLESLQAKVTELEAKKDEAYDALIKQGDRLRSFESNEEYKKAIEFSNTTLRMYNATHDECTALKSRIKELEE